MNDDYLIHYGVLGMKWGIRKRSDTKSGSGRVSKAKKSSSSRVKSFKNKVNKQLSKIDKQKAKKYAKVALGVAATAALIAGGVGGVHGMLSANAANDAAWQTFKNSVITQNKSENIAKALKYTGKYNLASVGFVDSSTAAVNSVIKENLFPKKIRGGVGMTRLVG